MEEWKQKQCILGQSMSLICIRRETLGSTSFPGSLLFPSQSAPWDRKRRDPGNEIGMRYSMDYILGAFHVHEMRKGWRNKCNLIQDLKVISNSKWQPRTEDQAPVVQRPDNFIWWIRHYSGSKINFTLNVVQGFRSLPNLAVVRVCIFACTRSNTEIFAQIETVG